MSLAWITQDKVKRWNIDVKLMMLPFYGMALTLWCFWVFLFLFPYEKSYALHSNRIKYHNKFEIHKKKVSFSSVAAHNSVWVASKTVTGIKFILWTSMNIKWALKVLKVSKQKYTYFFFIKLKPSLEPPFEDPKQKNFEQKKQPNENGYLLSNW